MLSFDLSLESLFSKTENLLSVWFRAESFFVAQSIFYTKHDVTFNCSTSSDLQQLLILILNQIRLHLFEQVIFLSKKFLSVILFLCYSSFTDMRCSLYKQTCVMESLLPVSLLNAKHYQKVSLPSSLRLVISESSPSSAKKQKRRSKSGFRKTYTITKLSHQ